MDDQKAKFWALVVSVLIIAGTLTALTLIAFKLKSANERENYIQVEHSEIK